MQNKAHIDFETRSPTDLRKSGVHRYAEDPNTRPWGFSWRIDNGPRGRWMWGDPDPEVLLQHIRDGYIVAAHNAIFERTIWNYIVRRYFPHWPELKISQQDCTMSRAAAVSYPQDLGSLCAALKTPNQKDKEGQALMMQMAKPRKFNADGTITWWDEPYKIQRLMQYCDTDIDTECDIDVRIPALTPYERAVWEFDQIINDRGIYIDVEAVKKCVELVDLAKKSADAEMRRLTGRNVKKCSQDREIVAWITARGIPCTTVKKGEQDDLKFMASLHGDELVRDVIDLRADSKKTSTAKYKAMLECVCRDGRIRGTLNYHGAGPGRWAGRLIQPQNFPRLDYEKEGYLVMWLVDLLESKRTAEEVFEMITAVYGESGTHAPMRLLSKLLRSMIKAAPGNKLVGGDFSNIEGRIAAWYGNEQWKLQAFRDYDTIIGYDSKQREVRKGPDLYNVAYAKSFAVDIKSVDNQQRQIGKCQELALGFQGSIGAFIMMGATYGVNPYDLTDPVRKAVSQAVWDATAAQYEHSKDKNGLQINEWTAIKIIVDGWRRSHPGIVQSWWDLQDAAVEAVSAPQNIITVLGGKISYYFDGQHLWCILPSGRMICYASAFVKHTEQEYTDKLTGEVKKRWKNVVHFWGYKDGRWKEMALYGGLQFENIVQGTARDVMVDRMFAVEHDGFPIILTVHDEIVAEVAKNRTDLNEERFAQIMSVLPVWAQGLPLTAKAWEDERYVK